MRKQQKQEKIRVSNGEDLLAFIPQILGYWPDKALVCIGMAGKALRATMRLDLPPAGGVDAKQFAAIAAGQLASDEQSDGVLIAIFGDNDWTDPAIFPHQDLYSCLRTAFAAEGMPVRDAWYVGENHWRSVECTNPSCCPWPGQGNEKIVGSFVNAEFIYRGRRVEGNPNERVPAMTAVTDQDFALKISRSILPFLGPLAESGLGKTQLGVTLGAWERSLTHWPERPDAAMSAYLLASLGNAGVRDAVMVSLAMTPELSLAGLLGVGYLTPDAPTLVVPVNWCGGNQADGYDITVLDESDHAGGGAAATFGAVLLGGNVDGGRCDDAPNWTRLDRAEELLLFLAQSSQGPANAPALCILGWIQWCRGRGTWAGAYFQQAQNSFPGYKLAHLLEQLLECGYIAPWAKNEKSAWPGYSFMEETS
ncbi:DUF4192 domain-containing protein [Arthrobacter alpinus]|uniref:DUF4192 domain-containing protein n=1 Tax=Arthrobacter alpinus TaxID=656366 RepID=UPI001647344B|nr:DUF4192 domain-containing protein [Arthrobacter alpinus]